MRCINAFFIDITNIFVNMTDFSCYLNQKDALRIPDECLCVILTYYFLLCNPNLYHTQFIYIIYEHYIYIHTYMNCWASEASTTLGCSIEISRDIMCRFVCLGMPKCVGGITWTKNAHAQLRAVKNDLRHPCYSFLLYGYPRAALAWTK